MVRWEIMGGLAMGQGGASDGSFQWHGETSRLKHRDTVGHLHRFDLAAIAVWRDSRNGADAIDVCS